MSQMEAAAGPQNAEFCALESGAPVRRWREVELVGDVRPGERSGASAVIYRDALYVLGGYGGSGRLDDLYKFDFAARTWAKVMPRGTIPAGRENNGAVVQGNKMYLFGGYSGFTWLNDFHAFNFDTNTWAPVPNSHTGAVPSTRFGYVSAVHENFFFVFGGYDGSTWLNDMFEFDIDRGMWSNTPAQGIIPSGRSCPSWATHSGSIFLFGGYDGVHRMNDFHQFRMETRTWSTVRSAGQVPSPRYFHASVVYANSLFLFGGYSGQERLNDLYEFRFDHNTWSMVSAEAPPSGRSSLVAEVYGNSLFVFGGYNGTIVLNDFYEFRFEPVTIPPSSLVDDMMKLMNNPVYSDVVFLVEGKQVHATRAQLAARSEHFRAMFYGGMREASLGRDAAPIELPDMQHSVFMALLEYVYTDKVGDISSDLAVHLLIAAEKFCLDRLKALCEDIIRKNISVDNVVSVMLAAHAHRADGLKDICLDYIIANEAKIKQSSRFKEIMTEPTLMYEILMRRKAGSGW